MFVPCLLQQFLGADRGAFGPHQNFQYGKFLSGQRDEPAVPEHLVPGDVEFDAGTAQHRR